MPRSAPNRSLAKGGYERPLPAAHLGRAGVRLRLTDVLRDTKSFLVAWGMEIKRRVLLVMDYLCHVIVHFSCRYEVSAG